MSVRHLVEVGCDGPGGGTDCPEDEARAWDNAQEIRALMRADGWAVAQPGGIDRCPNCRAQAEARQ